MSRLPGGSVVLAGDGVGDTGHPSPLLPFYLTLFCMYTSLTSPLTPLRHRAFSSPPPAPGRTVLAVMILAAGLPAGGAAGQSPPDGPRDPLEAVVEEALRRNHAVAAAGLAADVAEARYREATARGRPLVSVESRYTRTGGALDLGEAINPANAALNQLLGGASLPTDLDLTLPLRHESRLRLVHPLLNLELGAARDAARHTAEGGGLRRAAVVRRVAAEAQTLLLQASAARDAREILESSLRRTEEGERVAGRLVEEGVATPIALLQARADRREMEQRLEEAMAAEAAAGWALNRLLGRPLDTPVEAVAREALPAPLPPSLAELEAGMRLRREELAEVDAGLRTASAGVRAARAARLPSVALAAEWGVQGQRLRLDARDESWSASLLVSWPLFTSGSSSARRRAAGTELRRLQVERRDVEEGILLQLRSAHRAYQAAVAALPWAEDRLTAARELFHLTGRRYEEGLATPLELAEARSTLAAAELGLSLILHQQSIRWVELEYAAALRTLPTSFQLPGHQP